MYIREEPLDNRINFVEKLNQHTAQHHQSNDHRNFIWIYNIGVGKTEWVNEWIPWKLIVLHIIDINALLESNLNADIPVDDICMWSSIGKIKICFTLTREVFTCSSGTCKSCYYFAGLCKIERTNGNCFMLKG